MVLSMGPSTRCSSHPTNVIPFRPKTLARTGVIGARRQRISGVQFFRGAPVVKTELAWQNDKRIRASIMAQATSGAQGGRQAPGQGRRGGGDGRMGRRSKRDSEQERLEERVVQVSRVSKTVKGGRNISFRAVAVVGNENGRVGVGNKSAKEIGVAVSKAVEEARKNMIDVPLSPKTRTVPHRVDLSYGAAKVMVRPASDGTGVIAGGAMKVVLELAGIKNCFGKQLGSDNPMNNAKATLKALQSMKTFKQVAQERGVSVPYLLGLTNDHQGTWDTVRKEQRAKDGDSDAKSSSASEAEGSPTEPVAA